MDDYRGLRLCAIDSLLCLGYKEARTGRSVSDETRRLLGNDAQAIIMNVAIDFWSLTTWDVAIWLVDAQYDLESVPVQTSYGRPSSPHIIRLRRVAISSCHQTNRYSRQMRHLDITRSMQMPYFNPIVLTSSGLLDPPSGQGKGTSGPVSGCILLLQTKQGLGQVAAKVQ